MPETATAACVLCGGGTWHPLFVKHGFTFARCGTCGLVSIHPLPSPAELEAHHRRCYDEGVYAVHAAAEDVRHAIAAQRLADVAAVAPDGPWMEVGCGTGAFLAAALRAGHDVEGLDLSAAAVAQAQRAGLPARCGAVEAFEPRTRYALVAAFDLVEHLRDPLAFVRLARGWLRPGGVLAMTVPNVRSLLARVLGRAWFQYWPPDHLHYFDPDTVRRLLETAGFGAVRVRPITKPVTLDYAAARLRHSNPGQARLLDAALGLVPAAVSGRPLPLPAGEMLVVAYAP
jgi:SAM-dependent methyltransferase